MATAIHMITASQYAIGYDWDENGGVFAVVDRDQRTHRSIRVPATAAGLAEVVALGEQYANDDGSFPPIVVEATRRPFLQALETPGFVVFVANADALKSYRKQMGSNNRKKSDKADAAMLGHRLLMFPQNHRLLAPMSGDSIIIGTLSRMHRNLTDDCVVQAGKLRSVLAEVNPAILQVWSASKLTRSTMPATYLLSTPTASEGFHLTEDEIHERIVKAGHKVKARMIAGRLRAAYQTDFVRYTPDIDDAFGIIVTQHAEQLLKLLETRAAVKERLDFALHAHPMYELLSPATGAAENILGRIIAEVGDDPERFANLRGFLAYAAVVPFTAQSGQAHRDQHRPTKGNRLHAALWDWATAAVLHHDGAKTVYWQRRDAGDFHPTAIRKVAEKIASSIWFCLNTGAIWDDSLVWPEPRPDLDEFVIATRAKNKARKSTKAVNHGIKMAKAS